MPSQSGASEINPGNNWINRGSGRDRSQAMKATAEDAKSVAMRTVLPLTVAMLLGFGATALCRGGGTGDGAKWLFGCDRERQE